MNTEISLAAGLTGCALAIAATFGAIAGTRAIDAHFHQQECIAERTAAGITTDSCYELGARF